MFLCLCQLIFGIFLSLLSLIFSFLELNKTVKTSKFLVCVYNGFFYTSAKVTNENALINPNLELNSENSYINCL